MADDFSRYARRLLEEIDAVTVLTFAVAPIHAGLLQLDDHARQAVDEADQIWSASVERARDAELADKQEIIVFILMASLLL